jgi:O-Antigen ligase
MSRIRKKMPKNDTLVENYFPYFLLFLLFAVVGLLYLAMFATGGKPIVVAYLLSALFLGFALSIRHVRPYLIFVLILCIPLQLGHHILYDPVKGMESTPFMSGIRVDITDLILLALYAHWIAAASFTKRMPRLKIGHPFGAILLIWIIFQFLSSSVTAVHFRYSVYECISLFKGFLLFFYLVNNTSSMEDLRLIVYALFAATMEHALYVVWQYATGLNYALDGTLTTYVGPEGFRSVGFFGDPDSAAAMMSVVFPMALACYFIIRKRSSRFWLIAGMFLVLIAIMFTQVRSAGFAVIVSSVTLLLLAYMRRRINSALFFKVGVSVTILLVAISPFVIHRFEVGTWGQDRWPLMVTAWQMIKSHWILGVGVNNYQFEITKYLPLSLRQTWEYIVHDQYMLIWAETGLFGFLIYYTLNLVLGIKLWRLTRSESPWIFIVSAGLFSWLIGSIPHRIFSLYHEINLYLLFCVVLALTYLASTLNSGTASAPGTNPEPGNN